MNIFVSFTKENPVRLKNLPNPPVFSHICARSVGIKHQQKATSKSTFEWNTKESGIHVLSVTIKQQLEAALEHILAQYTILKSTCALTVASQQILRKVRKII